MKIKSLLISMSAIVVCILAAVISMVCFSAGTEKKFSTMEERVKSVYNYKAIGTANYRQYTYDELKDESAIVVIATPVEELTTENSYISSDKPVYFDTYSSYRQVYVLKYIKGTQQNFYVRQWCAKNDDGEVLQNDDASYPLIKDDVYALFMNKPKDVDDTYSPLCADNGTLNLSYLKLNRRADLAAMTAIDLFDTDFPDDLKDAYMKSRHPGNLLPEETLIPVFDDNKYPWQSVSVTTPYTADGMDITVEYTTVDGVFYFRTEGYPGYYDGTW